jgi:hypothetical protein
MRTHLGFWLLALLALGLYVAMGVEAVCNRDRR